MKYKAVVMVNNPEENDCPFPGCIRVINPKLFGVKKGIETLSDPADILKAHFLSPWVKPHFLHPMDMYIPFSGETVYIEQVDDGEEWVWTGVETGRAYKDPLSGDTREGLNHNSRTPSERTFGLRNGSFITFSEFLDKGRFVLEVMGPNSTNPDRKGPSIMIDGTPENQAIMIADGNSKKSIYLDATTDDGVIAISDKENDSMLLFDRDTVVLSAFNKRSVSLTRDEASLDDKDGNVVKLNSQGIEITDKNGNKAVLSSEGVKISDTNGNEVILTSEGVKLKTGDAATWLPNVIGTCPFTGVPHGGSGAGIIKLKGA